MRLMRLTALFMLAAGHTAVAATLTPFERTYGSPAFVDEGALNMIPVTTCPEGGFLAVGSAEDNLNETTMPYLVRTRADGTRLWETHYPEDGAAIYARGVVESHDGGFFVGGGRLEIGGPGYDVWIMKIDCQGRPVWARTYDAGGSETARTMIEATTGDPAHGTRPSDLIIAGDSGLRPMLMRIRSDGTALWQRVYDNGLDPIDVGEWLGDVIEARPVPGALTGDVVAAGTHVDVLSDEGRGYALRVDGNTGGIDPLSAVQGLAYFGTGTQMVELGAVVELPSRELVFLGRTGPSYFAPTRLFAVRTTPAPWMPLNQRTIGDLAVNNNVGDAIVKHLVFWNQIALAGAITSNGAKHAFTLDLSATGLTPVAGSGRLYGDNTYAAGITPLSTGAALAGGRLSVNQQGFYQYDMFLVRTDGLGHTGCDQDWAPSSSVVQVDVVRQSPVARRGDVVTNDPSANVIRIETPTTSSCH
jgi:hypothetical protein